MKHKVLILIPAYNEGRNIYGIIKNINYYRKLFRITEDTITLQQRHNY